MDHENENDNEKDMFLPVVSEPDDAPLVKREEEPEVIVLGQPNPVKKETPIIDGEWEAVEDPDAPSPSALVEKMPKGEAPEPPKEDPKKEDPEEEENDDLNDGITPEQLLAGVPMQEVAPPAPDNDNPMSAQKQNAGQEKNGLLSFHISLGGRATPSTKIGQDGTAQFVPSEIDQLRTISGRINDIKKASVSGIRNMDDILNGRGEQKAKLGDLGNNVKDMKDGLLDIKKTLGDLSGPNVGPVKKNVEKVLKDLHEPFDQKMKNLSESGKIEEKNKDMFEKIKKMTDQIATFIKETLKSLVSKVTGKKAGPAPAAP